MAEDATGFSPAVSAETSTVTMETDVSSAPTRGRAKLPRTGEPAGCSVTAGDATVDGGDDTSESERLARGDDDSSSAALESVQADFSVVDRAEEDADEIGSSLPQCSVKSPVPVESVKSSPKAVSVASSAEQVSVHSSVEQVSVRSSVAQVSVHSSSSSTPHKAPSSSSSASSTIRKARAEAAYHAANAARLHLEYLEELAAEEKGRAEEAYKVNLQFPDLHQRVGMDVDTADAQAPAQPRVLSPPAAKPAPMQVDE